MSHHRSFLLQQIENTQKKLQLLKKKKKPSKQNKKINK